MGNKQFEKPFNFEEWKEVSESYIKHEPGKPVLLKSHNSSPSLAQKYTFEVTNPKMEEEIAIYELRKSNPKNIVAVYEYVIREKCWTCSSDSYEFNVIIEHIPRRLSNFANLTIQECVYILHESLKGYHNLRRYNKICYPVSNMIGIKNNAQIKVWVNSNWAINGCRHSQKENYVIEELINSIRNYCQEKSQILQNLKRIQPLTFESVLLEMKKKYNIQVNEGHFLLQQNINQLNHFIPMETKPSSTKAHITSSPKQSSSNPKSRHPSHITTDSYPRKHNSCNLNGEGYQKDVDFCQQIPNVKYVESSYYNSQRNRSSSSTVQRNLNKLSAERHKNSPPARNMVHIKYNQPQQSQKMFLSDELNINVSEKKVKKSGFEVMPNIQTKKYINFIYKNSQQIERKDNVINPFDDGKQEKGEKQVKGIRNKVGRQKNRDHIFKKQVEEIKNQPNMDVSHFALELEQFTKNKEKKQISPQSSPDYKGLVAVREVESIQTSDKREDFFETPNKSSKIMRSSSEISSKEAVEEFKYFLRSTPTITLNEKESQNEEVEREVGKVYINDVKEIIVERQEEEENDG